MGAGLNRILDLVPALCIPDVSDGQLSPIPANFLVYRNTSDFNKVFRIRNYTPASFTNDQDYLVRVEVTFLLSDSIAQ